MIENLDMAEVIREVMRAQRQAMHTALPAKVVAVKAKTIDVRPVINFKVRDEEITYPVMPDVPPVFLSGGSSNMTFPIAVNDYCLLVFSQRCFDYWYDGQDFALPPEPRLHDPSDAFAIVGLHNKAGALDIPTETTILGNMRLGVAAPIDFAALASKVTAQLEKLREDMTTLKSATSTGLGASLPGNGTATKTAFDTATASVPQAHDSVASAHVKAE